MTPPYSELEMGAIVMRELEWSSKDARCTPARTGQDDIDALVDAALQENA